MTYTPVIQDRQYYLDQIRSSVHRNINPEEEKALLLVLDKIVRLPSPKIIDLNIPFWMIKRLYIQIYLGIDKRTQSRKERDKFNAEKLKEYKERNARYYFVNLPEHIQNKFNFEEKRLIEDVFNRAIKIPTRKILESNFSFKLKQKFYLTFYLGLDRRKGRRSSPNGLMNRLSFAGSAFIYLFVIIFIAYFAKSVLNYDIIQGSHGIDYLIEKLGLNK